MILDCAKNVDIRDLKNKINSCLKIEKFEAFRNTQGVLNANYEEGSKDIDEKLKNVFGMLELTQDMIDKVKNDMD